MNWKNFSSEKFMEQYGSDKHNPQSFEVDPLQDFDTVVSQLKTHGVDISEEYNDYLKQCKKAKGTAYLRLLNDWRTYVYYKCMTII